MKRSYYQPFPMTSDAILSSCTYLALQCLHLPHKMIKYQLYSFEFLLIEVYFRYVSKIHVYQHFWRMFSSVLEPKKTQELIPININTVLYTSMKPNTYMLLFILTKTERNFFWGGMPNQIFILWIINVSHFKHVITITRYWLYLNLYIIFLAVFPEREKTCFSFKLVRTEQYFCMNQCEI